MSIERQTEVFYGVLIAKHDNDPQRQEPHSYTVNAELYEKFGDNEFVADGVMRWMCGDYDHNNLYFVIHQDGYARKILEDGGVRHIPPNMPLYVAESWRSVLLDACDKLELTPLSEAGWFVVSDVS